MNFVIASPHRDDAAFSLTLTIQRLLRSGHRVTVMNCFTRSEYAPFADAAFVHLNDQRTFISALRSKEDEAWRRLQKNDSLQFADLNLKDAPLRLRCPLEELCTRELDATDKALTKISTALEQHAWHALLLPLALGGHLDHRTVREAGAGMARDQPVAFYEDLPYATRPEVTPNIEAVTQTLAQDYKIELSPTLSPGDFDAVSRKRRSVLCYDSQIDDTTADAIAAFADRYGGTERLWVTAAWKALDPFSVAH